MTTQEDLDDLYTLPEVARLLGIRNLSVKEAIDRGALHPARKMGGDKRGVWIITRGAVARYLAAKEGLRRSTR